MDGDVYREVMNVLSDTSSFDEVIRNATPQQIAQAQELSEKMGELRESFFLYVSNAFRELFLWKFNDSYGLKTDALTDVIKLKDKTIHVYLGMCDVNYDLTAEIGKIKKMLRASDHATLDKCNSVLLSKVPVYYADKIYPENKEKLKHPRMCLINDSKRCIFLLDEKDNFGISVKFLVSDI